MKKLMLGILMVFFCAVALADETENKRPEKGGARREMREPRERREQPNGNGNGNWRGGAGPEQLAKNMEKTFRELVDVYDADKDGKLSAEELQAAEKELDMDALQKKMRLAFALRTYKECDANSDGTLSDEELKEGVKKMQQRRGRMGRRPQGQGNDEPENGGKRREGGFKRRPGNGDEENQRPRPPKNARKNREPNNGDDDE